jgi:hypothetical protein
VRWRRALLFFFPGSGEREREGEQVLLTWALGTGAITLFLSLIFCDMGFNLVDATKYYQMFHLLPLEFEVPLHNM